MGTADAPPPEPSVISRPTPEDLADAAASWVAATLRSVVASRGQASVAFSGGSTPGLLFRALASEEVDWERIHVFQVDERIAPNGHPDRNLTALRASLVDAVGIPAANVHAMPVDALVDAGLDSELDADLDAAPSSPVLHPGVDPSAQAAAAYAATIGQIGAGVIDVVHLGLGDDGHTASLVPGDPALDVRDRDVTVTGIYQSRRRMTLTYPVLDRAGAVLWLVAGGAKAAVLPRLVAHDPSIPAGRVRNENAVVFADDAAAAHLGTGPT